MIFCQMSTFAKNLLLDYTECSHKHDFGTIVILALTAKLLVLDWNFQTF